MNEIRKIVKLVLISGYLKNHKPLSLLLVGKSGSGKTEAISSYRGKSHIFLTDLTYMGLLDELEKKPFLKHIIVPDFLKITHKKRATTNNLISLLNALLEEGVGKISLYNYKKDLKGRVCGLITATTKSSFAQNKKNWKSIGFVSRMLICSYDFTEQTIDEICNYINSEKWLKEPTTEKLVGYKMVEVKSDPSLNANLNLISKRKFRTLKQLQTLAKCNAITEGRREVKKEDIEEIIRLSKFLNLNFTKI